MRVYLDNCSYNRPYDDQSQMRISLETQAKLQIQAMIKNKELEVDAYHTACAVLSNCDYLITTDDRLLKYRSDRIKIVDPTAFIREMEVQKL